MSTGLSRIDDLLSKMRGVYEADAPPAVSAPVDAPAETPPTEPEKKEPEAGDDAEKTENKLSADAQDFISKKISKLDKEGYPQKQAIAIAFSMARKAGYDVPEAPKEDDEPEAEKPAPEVPPMQPRKDEPQDEYMEAFGISKAALLAAKEELTTYSDFLAKYRDGDINAFESSVSENDSELATRCKSRPPQAWFSEAVRLISQDESVNDPAELAAWLWTHWVPKSTRAKLAGQ